MMILRVVGVLALGSLSLVACGDAKNDNGKYDGGGGGPQSGSGVFPSSAPFYQDISKATLAADSNAIINGVAGRGGWGNGNRFQMDFSIEVLAADSSLARRDFDQNDDFYDPDCDSAPMPVPANGRLEGEDGYACENDGDCHLIVVQGSRLYEMWRADLRGNDFSGGCLAVWDLKKNYWATAAAPNYSRGNGCSSADAAGLPITPLLFSADEVKAGKIAHAIRFILPNNRIRNRSYVYPGTHATGAASGDAGTPPYGSHWRLKGNFDEASLPSEGARVVARALKTYGMYLADGGQIALTGQSDTYTAAKWEGLLDPRDLASLDVTDFEVVDGGEAFDWGEGVHECQRTPLTE